VNQVNSEKLSYRAEIDGLRALAVISVILYHAQILVFGRDWFEGGYIGVDIFFVISGYLITRLILSDLYVKGSFSLLNFYERRARRILPMLFILIFASIPFAWQKLLPSDFVEYAESILASLFFGSNFFFYFTTTEYGADSSLLKPLLHTWSLGIEEQFYLVFPILAIVVFKYFRNYFLIILVALSLVSLQFAELMEARNSELNFYLPFSRFWELAVGSVLACREFKSKHINQSVAAQALPMVGLCMLLYSVLFFDGESSHPGFLTLIPVVGVALIIGFSSKDELVGKLFGGKVFVWIGLISYSAYLWHFPIFAFSRMGPSDPNNYDKLMWIGLTFVLSSASYLGIERPFRNRRVITRKLFSLSMAVSLMVCLSFVVFAIGSEGYAKRFPSWSLMLSEFDRDNNGLQQNSWGLLRARLDSSPNFKNVEKRILIAGNSHAKDIYNALSQNVDMFEGFDFLRIQKTANFQISCFDEGVSEYADIRNNFYNSEQFKDASTILVSTSWSSVRPCDDRRNDWPISSDFVGLEFLIKKSKEEGKHVALMGQSPRFKVKDSITVTDRVVDELRTSGALNDLDIGSLKARVDGELYKNVIWETSTAVWSELMKIAAIYEVPLYKKDQIVCSHENQVCDGLTGHGSKVFYDGVHYTLDGAKLFGARMAVDDEFRMMLK